MRTTWFYEIGAPSNPECIGSTKATTASEAWQRVWAKAKGRPCRMARSRKVQSIDRGRTALAAGRTVRKVGSDGVTEYMADGGMSAEALYLLVIHGDVEPELLGPFSTESSRTDRARLHREEHGDEDGLYRVNATGTVDVDSYTGREIEPTDESEQVAMGLDPIPDDTPSLDPPWWEAR